MTDESPLATYITLQLFRNDVGRSVMLRVHLVVHRYFSANIANHATVYIVSVFDVLRNVRHQNHSLAVRAFGASVSLCNMLVQHFLSSKAFHASQGWTFEFLDVVHFFYVAIQSTVSQKMHITCGAPGIQSIQKWNCRKLTIHEFRRVC